MIRVRTIGECALQVGTSHVGPEAERLFATLLLLVTERGRRVARSRVIALVWPDAVESNGRHCLRQTIYKLRQLGAAIDVSGGYLELPAAQIESDLSAIVTAAEFDPDEVPVDAPFGEFLPGYAPSFSAPLQEWVEKQRDYVHAQTRRALVKAIVERRAESRWSDVESLARRCLALDPLNEEATLALAEAAAMTGSKTQALRILDTYLTELGPAAGDIALPAEILRRRIAERLKQPRYIDPSEAFFVGRADVMTGFGTDLQSARGGFGSAHLVWGPSGIGKSRLTVEVAKLAALNGLRVQRASCQSTDVGRPLSIFADSVPALRKMKGAAGVDPKSIKYLKRLTEYDEALADPPEDPYDSAVLFANVRQAIFDLFDAVSTECPLLFVVDDVHWLDTMSWGVLRELMESARTHRLLVLCTSRTPHATPEPPTDATRGLRVQRLEALTPAACEELIAAVTRDAPRGAPDARLREWTVTVAEGNPLFVRALIGHWLNGYPEYTLPPSLEALIEERLNRLTPAALRVLQACAVLGKNSTLDRVERILGYDMADLLSALSCLDKSGAITTSPPSIRVKHDVLQRAACSRLGPAERMLLHRRVASTLETEIDLRSDTSALWDCMHHWREAGESSHGVSFACEWTERALRLGLVYAAEEVATLALHASQSGRDELRSLSALRCTWRAQGNVVRLRSTHARMTELSREQSQTNGNHDDLELEEAELRALDSEDSSQVRSDLWRCVIAVEASREHRVRAASLCMMMADNACDAALAERVMNEVESWIVDDSLSSEPRTILQLVFHSSYGELGTALRAAETLVASRRSSPDARRLTQALRFQSIPLRRLGDFVTARRILGEAHDLARSQSLADEALRSASAIASCYLDEASVGAARPWVEQMLAQVTPDLGSASVMTAFHCAARAALESGDIERAAIYSTRSRAARIRHNVLRQRIESEVIAVRLKQLQQHEIATARLDRLVDDFHTAGRYGGQDFTAVILFEVLREENRKRADELVIDYARCYRRESFPLPDKLRNALRLAERVG